MRQGRGEINQMIGGPAGAGPPLAIVRISGPVIYRNSTARRLAARPAPSTLTK